MKSFIIGRLKSIVYAVKGMFILAKTEHSIISQISVFILITILGIYCQITRIEWTIQILCFGLILTAESLNTAIEKVCDFIHPDYHKKIGFIKDISAGAVSFAALTGFIIAIIIYYPYFTS